jgi:Protein of unknown function (DUF2510)
MTVTLANKVRLWFGAGCEALVALFVILTLVLPAVTENGLVVTKTAIFGYLDAAICFQVAAIVLASISLYRFVKPADVRVKSAGAPSSPGWYKDPQTPAMPYAQRWWDGAAWSERIRTEQPGWPGTMG